MEPGPGSVLTKAVVEEFSPRFMTEPAVVFISESGNKVIVDDYELARSPGITISPDRNLPDIIMADIAPEKPLTNVFRLNSLGARTLGSLLNPTTLFFSRIDSLS